MASERKATADPARSLAILWRTREPTSRSAGQGLSVDRIVRAAIDIADAEGLDALTMRRVGEALGVGTMSVYTYVPGKAELVAVMIDTAYGEMPRSAVEGDWRARLERIAHDNLALYQRHPWMLRAETTRPVLGPHLVAKYDHELGAVADIGTQGLACVTASVGIAAQASASINVSVSASAQVQGKAG